MNDEDQSCSIVVDPMAHTIPAAFYRNLANDLIIEYVPTKPGSIRFDSTSDQFRPKSFSFQMFTKFLFARKIIY